MKSQNDKVLNHLRKHIDFKKLIPEEEKQIPFIIKTILSNSKKGIWVKSNEIILLLKGRGLNTGGGRFRAMINHIRTNGLLPGLIASYHGYYVSKDPEELEYYLETLKSRETEIKKVRKSFEKHYIETVTKAGKTFAKYTL